MPLPLGSSLKRAVSLRRPGITHNAYPVLDDSRRRSLFFNWVPSIDRDNLPGQRMSTFPDSVLERLADERLQLTSAGYI